MNDAQKFARLRAPASCGTFADYSTFMGSEHCKEALLVVEHMEAAMAKRHDYSLRKLNNVKEKAQHYAKLLLADAAISAGTRLGYSFITVGLVCGGDGALRAENRDGLNEEFARTCWLRVAQKLKEGRENELFADEFFPSGGPPLAARLKAVELLLRARDHRGTGVERTGQNVFDEAAEALRPFSGGSDGEKLQSVALAFHLSMELHAAAWSPTPTSLGTNEPCSMTSQFRTTGVPLPHHHAFMLLPKQWMLCEEALRTKMSKWLLQFGCIGRAVGGLEQQVLALDKDSMLETGDTAVAFQRSLEVLEPDGFSGRWLIIVDKSWAGAWLIVLYIFKCYIMICYKRLKYKDYAPGYEASRAWLVDIGLPWCGV